MTVLVWNSWITPAGGMERVALSIANGLADRGCRVILVGPYDQVPVLRASIHESITYVHCDFDRTPSGLLRNTVFLRRLIRQYRVDVISAHGSLIPLLGLDIPVVWTEHGPRYGDQSILKGWKTLPWSLIRARLRSGKWLFVACSRYVRDRICSELKLNPQMAEVIYNGVPNAAQLRSLPLPAFTAPWRIGFLGRLEPEKHPDDVFALDEILHRRGVDCRWFVWGDGSLASTLREKAEGHPRVRLCGLAKNAAAALAEVDALVFLSHGQMEGLPTVILEARLARRPVIAWDVTANPEATGPADMLVPPFDLEWFATALQQVLHRTPVAAEAAATSYEQMIEQYDSVLRKHAHRWTEARDSTPKRQAFEKGMDTR